MKYLPLILLIFIPFLGTAQTEKHYTEASENFVYHLGTRFYVTYYFNTVPIDSTPALVKVERIVSKKKKRLFWYLFNQSTYKWRSTFELVNKFYGVYYIHHDSIDKQYINKAYELKRKIYH